MQTTPGQSKRVLRACAAPDSVRCSGRDGPGAADDHIADYVSDLPIGLAGDIDFFHGQLGLVDEAYAGFGPLESLNHKGSRWSLAFGSWLLAPQKLEPKRPQGTQTNVCGQLPSAKCQVLNAVSARRSL